MNWLEDVITAIGQKIEAKVKNGGNYKRLAKRVLEATEGGGTATVYKCLGELVTPSNTEQGGVHLLNDIAPSDDEFDFQGYRGYTLNMTLLTWSMLNDVVMWDEINKAICERITCTDLQDISVTVTAIDADMTSVASQYWSAYIEAIAGKPIELHAFTYEISLVVCC